MKTYKFVPIILSLIFLVSCTSSHVLIGTKRNEISPASVKLYTSPPEKYKEIAYISASSKASWSFTAQGRMDAVIERLKSEAASLGANGIILQQIGDRSGAIVGNTNPSTGNSIFIPVNSKSGSGIAIFVTKE